MSKEEILLVLRELEYRAIKKQKERPKDLYFKDALYEVFMELSNSEAYKEIDLQIFNKITDLEAKLAESEEQRQHLKDWLDNEILTSVDHESYYATINEYEEEVKQLKQQLAEKEEQYVQSLIKLEKEYDEQLEKQAKIHYRHLKEKDQDKISFCVEQLEKVKELVEEKSMTQSPFGTQKIYASDVSAIIDNQIKQLKEMK